MSSVQHSKWQFKRKSTRFTLGFFVAQIAKARELPGGFAP